MSLKSGISLPIFKNNDARIINHILICTEYISEYEIYSWGFFKHILIIVLYCINFNIFGLGLNIWLSCYILTIIGSNPQTERPRPQAWSRHKRLGNYWRVGSGICFFSVLLTVLL